MDRCRHRRRAAPAPRHWGPAVQGRAPSHPGRIPSSATDFVRGLSERQACAPKIRTFIDHLVEYISEISLPVLLEKINLETVPKPGVPEAALGRQRGSTGRIKGFASDTADSHNGL